MDDGRAERPGVDPIQSIERSMALLDLFTARKTSMSLVDMAAELPWPKTTLHRYAVSLRGAGLLAYDQATNLYTLGPHAVRLGTAALQGLPLAQVSTPIMAQLVADSNLTSLLTIWDGAAPLVIRSNDDTRRLVSLTIREGSRLPAYESAAGTVFLAHSSEARQRLLAEPDGPRTLQERMGELDEVRATGLAFSDTLPGLRAVSSPVFQADQIAGALSLIGTVAQLDDSPASTPGINFLLSACDELSVSLGGTAPSHRPQARS